MLFKGRNLVKYPYSRWGWTRGGGKTWHGGLDIGGLDDDKIRMPSYNGKSISGVVKTARIVTDKSNLTWEWGWYVCVQLDANQTPDAVNFLYFCHCKELLVKVGQRVKTGDVLAVVGQTGNAAGTWTHCHFEVRAKTSGRGLDPTAYAGIPNAAGTYGEKETETMSENATNMQRVRITPNAQDDYIELAKLLCTLKLPLMTECSNGDAYSLMNASKGRGEYQSEYI